MGDLVQTLEQIIEAWWDLEVETQNHSWKLTAVNGARSWSPNKDLLNPVYVLIRKGDPFHLQRPHGVFEVIWGIDIGSLRLLSLSGSTLITVWVSSIMRVDQCSQIVVPCGVMKAVSGKSWLSAILGLLCKCTSKLPFAIWFALTCSLQRSMDTLHLPVKRLQDNQFMMKVFVPHGVTCYSSTTFVCIPQFENWQAVPIAAGKRAYPGRNPATMIYHRLNSSLVEINSLFVSADVIQLEAHEKDPAPEQAVSEGDASDSDRSESASDSEQNDPPSSLVLMQNSMSSCKLPVLLWAKISKTSLVVMISLGQNTASSRNWRWFQRDGHWHGYPSPCKHVDHLDRVLAGCWEVQATRTTPLDSLTSLHEVVKCLTMKLAVHLAKEVAAILRAVLTHETKKLYNDSTVHLLCSNYWIQPIYQELLYCTHRPDTMLPGKEKGNDLAVAWHGLQRFLNHPNSGNRRLLALASVTGLEVLAMRIPYRSGSRPTGLQWYYNSCNRRRTTIEQKTRLGWTRKWLLWTFLSNGRRHGQTDVCSSKLAIIVMAPGRATSGC